MTPTVPSTPEGWMLYSNGVNDTYDPITVTAAQILGQQFTALLLDLPDDETTTDDKLLAGWEAFRQVRRRYAAQGAMDTEPRDLALAYLDVKFGHARISRLIG